MLRPEYAPPDWKGSIRKSAGSSVWHINDGVAEELDSKEVTLVQDGWSDIHNQPVIASCVHTGNKSYFVIAEDTTSNKKTASYCASLA